MHTLQLRYVDNNLRRILSLLIRFYLLKLVFALGTAREWRREHAGFHYPSFYNFIVDYLETPPDEMSQKGVKELLKWWSRYRSSCLSQEYDVLIAPF